MGKIIFFVVSIILFYTCGFAIGNITSQSFGYAYYSDKVYFFKSFDVNKSMSEEDLDLILKKIDSEITRTQLVEMAIQ